MPMPNLPIKTGHVFIGMAIIMGVATVVVFSSTKHDIPKVQAKIETLDVVVPLTPINQGTTLSRNDITLVKWPAEYVPKGSIFSDPYKVVGRIAKQTLYPGEPIFVQKLSGSNTKGGLPALIPAGMRAVTISVSEIKGVAGFVKPGDHVDVLSTFDVPQEGRDPMKKTKTVLQDVLVLASAQTMVDTTQIDVETPDGVLRGEATPVTPEDLKKKGKGGDKDKDKGPDPKEIEKKAKEREKEKKEAEKAAKLVSSVTLALTPEQTQTMALAEETGDIRLALRPETDHGITDLDGLDSDKLTGKAMFQPPPPPAEPSNSSGPKAPPMPPPMLGTQVEFIQGGDKTLYNFNQ